MLLWRTAFPLRIQAGISWSDPSRGGDFPSTRCWWNLRARGNHEQRVRRCPGHFSFTGLQPNVYHIVINDDAYYPVDELEDVNPETIEQQGADLSPAREEKKNADPIAAGIGRQSLSGRPGDYNKRFPKKAVKEYERG